MTNKQSKKLAFLFGAATGTLITYFLMSEEGQQWKAETIKRARQFSRRMSDQAQEQLDFISRSMDIFVEGREIEDENLLAPTLPKETTQRVASAFKRGMKNLKEQD